MTIPSLPTIALLLGLGAGPEPEPPYYSREDYYPTAPRAVGLPSGPAELAQTHPGLYADYAGEMFGEGAYYIAGPAQPLAATRFPDWALRHALCPKLRLVALVRTGVWGTDAFDVARRLGAEIVSVPIAFRDRPKPPQGVRTTQLAVQRLQEALAGRVDVIFVNKLIAALPESAQQMILDKVQAGAGLVVVGHLPPDGPLMKALPVENPGQPYDDRLHDFRQTRGEGWLVEGIVWALWPGHPTEGLKPWVHFDPRHGNMMAYKPRPEARVWATCDGLPMVITGMIGRGRVVLMGYAGNRWDGSYVPLLSDANDTALLIRAAHYEEQMYSLLMKAAIYAAIGVPAVRLAGPADASVVLKQGARHFDVTVVNETAQPQKVQAAFVLRDGPTWEPLATSQSAAVAPARGTATLTARFLSVPTVSGPGGPADPLVEVSLRDGQGRPLDWATLVVVPEGGPRLQCTPTREVVFRNEPLAVQVQSDFKMAWSATDLWGRLIASGTCPAGSHQIALQPDYLSGLVTFRADALDGQDRILARAVREIYTPLYEAARDYYNLLWPRPGLPHVFRQFSAPVLRRQGGIDVVLNGGHYTDRYGAQKVLRGGLRSAMTNMGPRAPFAELPKFPEEAEKRLAQAQEMYTGWVGRYGPLTLHLQDERHSPPNLDLKLGEGTLAAFRQWLQAEYGSIDRLNQQWLTDYPDFSQVRPKTDPLEVVQQPGSFAPWLDLVRFVDREVALKHDLKLVELLSRETRGHVTVGFEGIFDLYGNHLNPYGALNVPLWFDSGVKMNNMAYGIGTPMWELCASLNPEADAGTWLGYESERVVYQTEPWRGVLSGATFMGWFIDSLWFTAEGAVADRLAWIEQYTRPLRQGVGRLLIEATRQFDPVAILADMRSSQLAWMVGWQMDPEGKARLGHWMLRPMGDSGNAFLTLCRDSGLSPAYITEGQILQGRLDQFKVLCLVYNLSLDEKVAEAIRQWVQRGGTLVADCGAAVANQHGRFAGPGLLDDVFGLKREGAFTTRAEAGDYTVGLLEPAEELIDAGCQKGNWYMVEYYEPNLKPTTAQAMGRYVFGRTAPMCLWNTCGQGRALYLGFLANRYRTEERDFTSLLPLWASVMRRAGVQPRLRLRDGNGLPLKGYTCNVFQDGAMLYAGVMKRLPEAPDQIVLEYAHAGHAYEVMTNRYLGHGRRVRVDLASGEPSKAGMPTLAGEAVATSQDALSGMALVAHLPCKVAGVKVTAQRGRRGQPLQVRVAVQAEGAPPDKHVLFLDVRDPSGHAAEPYCRNVVTAKGFWQGALPLAQNDLAGRWTLTVREAVSGLTAQTEVTID